MPLAIHHSEHHFTSGNVVRDIVIGMSDGLTVPFALAAGLSGAVAAGSTRIIVIGGLAEIAAGSIAMGLGGYLAARGDAEHYAQERLREEREVVEIPEEEKAEISRIFQSYKVTEQEAAHVVEGLARDPKAWVDFMMKFELGLEEPEPRRAITSAATIAFAYVAGGFIPLSPYMLSGNAIRGLILSATVTLAALGIFGFIKGRYTGTSPMRSAVQTVVIGGLAAGAAFLLAKLIS
jgi:VIT1/CCC1 family predicted Fe2+/Mn2+ transporter